DSQVVVAFAALDHQARAVEAFVEDDVGAAQRRAFFGAAGGFDAEAVAFVVAGTAVGFAVAAAAREFVVADPAVGLVVFAVADDFVPLGRADHVLEFGQFVVPVPFGALGGEVDPHPAAGGAGVGDDVVGAGAAGEVVGAGVAADDVPVAGAAVDVVDSR